MLKFHFQKDPLLGLDFCLQSLADFVRSDIEKRAFLLVPEEAKADTERRYMEVFDERGLMLAEVLSFKRLSYRIFSEIGGLAVERLSRNAKALLLTRILQSKKEEFPFLARLAGKADYAHELSNILGDFDRYAIPVEILREIANKGETAMTRAKLADFARLQEAFQSLKEEEALYDGDEDLDRLSKLLRDQKNHPRLAFLRETKIWVAGFTLLRAFTPQELRLLQVLSEIVEELTVVIAAPEMQSAETGAYYFAQKSAASLARYCPKYEVEIAEQKQPEKGREIYLWRSQDSLQELEAAAGEIKLLLKSGAYRRREIAIALCREQDLDRLSAVFKDYKLDPFIAEAGEIKESPLFTYITQLFSLSTSQGRPDNLISLAQTGLLPLKTRDLDEFENFLLASPIRYLNDLDGEYIYRQSGGDKAKEFYKQYLALHLNFARKLSGIKKAGAKARALIDFLQGESAVREHLAERIDEAEKSGESERALLLANSWESLISSLEECERYIADAEPDSGEFADLIISALSGLNPQGIPLGIDRVRVASPQQVLLYPAKVLFVLGATVNSFPPPAPPEGLLQNFEREFIEQESQKPMPNYRRDSVISGKALEHYLWQRGSEKFYLSCPSPIDEDRSLLQVELEEKKVNPQQIFLDKDLPDQRWLCPQKARRNLAASSSKESWHAAWSSALSLWKTTIKQELVDELVPRIYLPADLSKAAMDELRHISVSRLQTYNDCPYRYFASNLLLAQERVLYQPKPDKQGSFLHAIFEQANRSLIDDLKNKNREEQAKVIEAWQAKIRSSYVKDIYRSLSEQEEYRVYADPLILESDGRRLLRSVEEGLLAESEDLSVDGFLPQFLEYSFPQYKVSDLPSGKMLSLRYKSGGQERAIPLKGIIDRIDLNSLGEARLIDYKSSRNKLRAEELLLGKQLQLPLYAKAWSLLEEARPAVEINLEGIEMQPRKVITTLGDLEKSNKVNRRHGLSQADGLDLLSNYCLDYGEKILSEMGSGNISPSPLSTDGKKYPCEYCSYKSLCHYDERLTDQRGRQINLHVNKKRKLGERLADYLELYEKSGKVGKDLDDLKVAEIGN